MKTRVNFELLVLFGIFVISSIMLNPVLAQIPTVTGVGVKINTPSDSASVPVGDLTMYGASSDNNATNCQVYADWNDLKPMQIVTAEGPKGDADYSKWSYTYNGDYHGIVEGSNELTSKITCYDQAQKLATSKSYSINVTGEKGGSEIGNNTANPSTVREDTKVLPVKSISSSNNESSNDAVEKSNESTVSDSEDTKVLPVKSISSSNNESSNDAVEKSNESTVSDSEDASSSSSNNESSNDAVEKSNESTVSDSEDASSSSSNNESSNDTVEKSNESTVSDSEDASSSSSNNESSNDTVEKSNESTVSDSEDTKVIPVKNILPLYSESNEESIKSASAEDADGTEVTSTDPAELQVEPNSNETEVASTDTAELQVEPNSKEIVDSDSETYATVSSKQRGEIGESNTTDMSESEANEASNEGLTSHGESNTFFTFEPGLVADEFSNNDENTVGTSSNTDSSFSNQDSNDNSIFGLKFNGLDDTTKNKIEKKIEKLEDRVADRVQLFDLIG